MASLNTIRTNAWDYVYTYLQTTNAISTNNIYSAMNSKLISSVGYPMVIIHPPTTSFNKLSANAHITVMEISMLIEIYHTSSASAKALADEVTSKLTAGRNSFVGSGLRNMAIDGGDSDFWEDSNKTVHRIGFNVSFRYVESGT